MTDHRRAIHRGDGSHKRWETEQEALEREYEERRDEHLAAKAEALAEKYYGEEEL